MHRRHEHLNIPTEIIRSLVGISDTGSISKAAKLLGLSQPAVSSQIKRIEQMVGGSIFQKSANGSSTTELGKLVLTQARKILAANEQLLLLRGATSKGSLIRLGLSHVYSQRILEVMSKAELSNVTIYADNSAEIARCLLDGFTDVGVFLGLADVPPESAIDTLAQRDDEVTWVRSRDFTLSPGAPVPLLTWPGQIMHDLMIQALELKGMVYRIAFSSPDYHARIEAAKVGLGLTLLPKRLVPAPLIAANEYYLPTPGTPKMYLCTRPGFRAENRELVELLQEKLFLI
jgi:molybdate transport repressor ModE-like protein